MRGGLAALCALALFAHGADAQAPARLRERPPVETEEAGLWGISDRTEADARASGERIDDPALNAYLRTVTCRVAAEYCGDIRLYVMDRPYFNASMAPNGYMEIWSGLLLRAENEAELAFVLGHEVTHYVERHSLESFIAMRGRATAAMMVSLVAGVVGVPFIGDIAYLGTLASLFGFSRENEVEADARGFDRAIAAGYDSAAGVTLWRNLTLETQASDFDAVKRRATRGSIFNSHPISADRVAALQTLADARPAGGATERARYRAAMRPFLGAWLRQDLRRRDYGQSLVLIDRLLAARGDQAEDQGVLLFYRGEAYRLRRAEGDLARAAAAYQEAARRPDAPAQTWRCLAEIHEREGRRADARAAFQAYLERAPEAEDRLLIERRLAALESAA